MQNSADVARAALVVLMSKVARGDKHAFRSLYDVTSAKLYGIIIRILRDPDQTRDVLQEVYVRIFERAAGFDATVASPITWMAAIARNRALDEVRRVKPVMVEVGEDFDPPAETGHPLDSRERSEELKRLMDCLTRLDAEKRQMVMLAYYQGATREALSQRFSRPVATVKTLLHRGLAQLRECLQP
jgi:RNA polymerase sigma-70 factor, ECF subfamily